jgi:arginyl-tRNA synthetase
MIYIEQLLLQIIEKVYSLKLESVSLTNPPKPELWDYAFGCFLLARDTKKAPPQIAIEIKTYFDENKAEYTEIESMEVAAGYLNIKVANSAFTAFFLEVLSNGEIFANFEKKEETIIVDYIGANVGKPLHIGHMCTPNIWQSLVNLYRKLGYNVIGDSHIGDWGIIFGKLMYMWKNIEDFKIDSFIHKYKEEFIENPEDEYKINREKQLTFLLEKEGVDFLLTLYSEFHISDYSHWEDEETGDSAREKLAKIIEEKEEWARKIFKLLSEGNPESIKMWETFTRESIRFMNLQLARLNVKPDFNIGESFYEGLWLPKMENYPDLKWDMKSIVSELIEKWVATKNEDGSVGVVFPEETKLPSCILQKRDGTHGYLASDLAAIKYRSENWSPAKIVYSVDIRQELHFKQAFYIAKAAGWLNYSVISNEVRNPLNIDWSKNSSISDSSLHSEWQNWEIQLFHAANGFISLKDGAMSTRTGKIIRLEALLDEAESRAEKIILEKRQDIQWEELKKLSRIIWIGAIKYGYLSKSRLTNVVFDWDEFMTFEGNSGPYIQYAYVRAKSVLWDEKNVIHDVISASFEFTEEKELLKSLLEYKNILLQASRENFPHIIAGYAYELTKKFNSLYAKVPLQNETDEGRRNLRLLLVDTFARILKDAFSILAIDMPERM